MHILFLLREKARTGKELVTLLGIAHTNVSRHLHRLMMVGLVEGKRKGESVVFSLTPLARKSSLLWKLLERGLS